MDKSEKIVFVNDLVAGIHMDILNKISDGRIPDEWGGRELRKLVADKYSAVAYMSMDRGDMKQYRNDVMANNL